MMSAIVIFVAVAYALSGALSVVVWATGGYQSPLVGLGFVTMFLPTLAVLIVRSALNEGLAIDWNRLPARYLPLALFLIPITLHAIMLPRMVLAGPLPWQEWLTGSVDGLYHSPESRGWGVLTTPGLIARIAMNAGVGLAVVSTLALFEEIGWRG